MAQDGGRGVKGVGGRRAEVTFTKQRKRDRGGSVGMRDRILGVRVWVVMRWGGFVG